MKKRSVFLGLALSLFLLTACVSESSQKIVAEELDLNTSGAEEVLNTDDHGGFHGDGTAYIVLSDKEGSILKDIQNDNRWKPTPLDEVSEALTYGRKMDDGAQYGPYLTGESGQTLIPRIKAGYYILIDRHSDRGKTPLISRYSFNLTFAIYDRESEKLYYVKFDT